MYAFFSSFLNLGEGDVSNLFIMIHHKVVIILQQDSRILTKGYRAECHKKQNEKPHPIMVPKGNNKSKGAESKLIPWKRQARQSRIRV